MATARVDFQMVLLASQPGGNVLACGGYTRTSGTDPASYPNSCEIYSPSVQAWRSTGSMSVPRAGFRMMLLQDGTILAAGGYYGDRFTLNNLASSELYDPIQGSWSPTANSMTYPREDFEMVLLPDGTVLVAGGADPNTLAATATCEIYDPSTKMWSVTATFMAQERNAIQMRLLPDGTVLAAGGQSVKILTRGISYTNDTELFTPSTQVWALTGTMLDARSFFQMVNLPNGDVMAAAVFLTLLAAMT